MISRPSRRRLNTLLAVIAVSILPTAASAQTVDDTSLWFAAFGNRPIRDRADNDTPVRWWFDAHYRLFDDTDGFGQSIVRPGLGYDITDHQTLWAGYAWIRTSPSSGDTFDENRIWQQWTYAPTAGDFRFLHRSRFEQRYFDNADDVALRWRQLARVQRVFDGSPYSLVAWDEIFFNLNDANAIRAGLDQNRAFLGFGLQDVPLSPVRTEIGYLNQFINRQGSIDGMNHILSVNFFF